MSWVSKLLGGVGGGIIESVGKVADQFITTPDEKRKFELELEKIVGERFKELEATHRTELEAKERILVAELTQTDNFTKRARPSVVYTGLGVIVVNYVLIPFITQVFSVEYKPVDLPTDFWVAWLALVGTWSIGRSFEKVGMQSKTTSLVTGSKLLDR